MKVSELIRELETFKKHMGDWEVIFITDNGEELDFNKVHDGYYAIRTELMEKRYCEVRLYSHS